MAEPLTPADPEELGGYRLIGRLRQGFLAEAAEGGRVTVKILDLTEIDRVRLERELLMAQLVPRFCTAAVLDCDLDAPTPYVVSEYVEGLSLHERVVLRGPLRSGELDRLAVGTATALKAIHGAGIVHRDFKPANVILARDGPRVIDFCIVETHKTPAYFSPECLRGVPPAPPADVFAWAGTMVYAATGLPPFGHDPLDRIENEEPRLEGLPPVLFELLVQCFAKNPRGRPDARTVVACLVEGGAPVDEPSPRTPDKPIVALGGFRGTPPGFTRPPDDPSIYEFPPGMAPRNPMRSAFLGAALMLALIMIMYWVGVRLVPARRVGTWWIR